jgi:biopolymer transport protein ExbD
VRFRERREESPSVDLTPLIDVVFLLLIFFMVSTTFVNRSGLDLQLPEAQSRTEQQPDDPIRIGVGADGGYTVNGEEVSAKRLQAALTQQAKGREDPQVVVAADRAARHGAVTRAMDAASQAGLSRFAIQTQPGAESEKP